ncbi:T9SS type A sorting domain-containing protein [Polluticaenibacter yanchengensis]|uniref:T9SS type A sorting domain-containing protein n=1 Tax=Polluticaenibacter yanchengensis TaxID=3014562 RepID=A0ABT4UKI0_9BACT|nr:T9SS type A sorting domain-containing protein [Chitinophagaceae bacterium LY-5]
MLYPNPATNTINITHPTINEQTEFSIISAIGSVLQRDLMKYNTGNTTINISWLPPGVYFINILKNSSITTLRFIKK